MELSSNQAGCGHVAHACQGVRTTTSITGRRGSASAKLMQAGSLLATHDQKGTQESLTMFTQGEGADLRTELRLELPNQQIDRLLSIPPCLYQVNPM